LQLIRKCIWPPLTSFERYPAFDRNGGLIQPERALCLRAGFRDASRNIGCSTSAVADHVAPASRRETPPHAELFDAPGQRSVRGYLAIFFGPNAEVDLVAYDRMRSAPLKQRTVARTWSWPVFLGSFTWFFYR
jgi:hypothetical protein